jgi:hypothetical protein
MGESDRKRLMTEAIQLQQAVLDKLRQLPLHKQQQVLTFVDSLRPELDTKPTAALSLQQIAALPLPERHRLLQPHIGAIAHDFHTDPTLTEFAAIDGEDWELAND